MVYATAIVIVLLGLVNCDTCPEKWNQWRNKCYFVGEYTTSFKTDYNRCNGMNATLVTIESPEETEFVKTILGVEDKFYFLGAKRSKFNKTQYTWIDGRIINYTNWDLGEPNNKHFSNAHCIMINNKAMWHDYGCEGPGNKLFCQKIIKSSDGNDSKESESSENVAQIFDHARQKKSSTKKIVSTWLAVIVLFAILIFVGFKLYQRRTLSKFYANQRLRNNIIEENHE